MGHSARLEQWQREGAWKEFVQGFWKGLVGRVEGRIEMCQGLGCGELGRWYGKLVERGTKLGALWQL